MRQAELEISTGNVINDFAFVEEIKPDYPLIILDAIKILNGKGMVFTSGYHPQRILTLRFMVLWLNAHKMNSIKKSTADTLFRSEKLLEALS